MYFFYYVPVGLDVQIRRRATITYFLAIIYVILFFIYRYAPIGPNWNIGRLVFLPHSPSILTAIAHSFLHGGYLHLIGNIVYLVIFGRAIEDRFGPGRFYLIVMLSAVIGAYTHLFMTRLFAPGYLGYALIGASGSTSGILGAFLVRFYFGRVRIAYWVFCPLQGINRAGNRFVPVVLAILLWFLLQSVQTVLHLGMGGMRIAYSVHIGGFAVGAALALLFGAQGRARAEHCLVKARRHFSGANWFAAQGEYINYLDQVPNDALVHAETARAFRCTSETGRVRFHYATAIMLFMRRGERGEAEKALTEAMRAISGFTLPEGMHLDLACGLERSLKYNTALDAYRSYIERYPHSREAPFILLRMAGMLERRYEKFGEALACYRVIVNDYPNNCWVEFARHEIDRLGRSRIVLDASSGREA